MKRNSQLSGVLHVLLHMAERNGPMTSEVIARMLGTNAVVVRRTMAGLRDVYAAIGSPSLLAIGNRTESPGCLVEQEVNAALGDAFREAEALLLSRLADVTLASLHRALRGRLPRRGRTHDLETAHAS